MSIQPPQGILNIPNATLRVGKLAVDSTAGFDTVFNNVERNTILLEDSTEYTETKQWDLKMPNIFVATFEIKGDGSSFNFRNTSNGDATKGYTLTFSGTTLTLKYGAETVETLTTATIPNLNSTYGKVYLTYEKQHFTVTVDGTLVLTYTDTTTRTPPEGEYANFFAGTGGGFKNLKVVAGHFISDGTSNIAYVGGGEVAVGKALAFNRVSNVSQIKVDSNVVAEYTGPHDRPLRKYPEVALTADAETGSGYKGYKVTASNDIDNNSNLDKFRAFNGITGNEAWGSGGSQFTSGTGVAIVGGDSLGNVEGQWLKLQLPLKIKLSHIKLTSRDITGIEYPKDFQILGSNDDSNWTQLINVVDAPYTQHLTLTHHVTGTVDSFQYLAVVVTKTYGGTGVTISELEYYGHEEGSGSLDTTLKSVYNVPATTGTQLEVYYDGQDYTGVTSTVNDKVGTATNATIANTDSAITFDSTYKAWTFGGTDTRTSNFQSSALPSNFSGDQVHSVALWFKCDIVSGDTLFSITQPSDPWEDPKKVISVRFSDESGGLRYLFWSNDIQYDGTEAKITKDIWYHLCVTYSGGGGTTKNKKLYLNGNELHHTSTSGDYPGANLELPSGSVIRLGSRVQETTRFFGSIANFRLYSKVLNADQVKELYDYQKDYFLGSKSQVTLYKGHLGVGVTEPSGQLELAGDERIQEYPPRAMTGYETLMEGHGVFCVSASSNHPTYKPWYAFDGETSHVTNDNSWISGTDALYDNASTGLPTSIAARTNVNGGDLVGEWIQMSFPYKIHFKQVALAAQTDSEQYRAPKDATIAGSNDGVTWDTLHTFTNQTSWTDNQYNYYTMDGNVDKAYKYVRIIIQKVQGNSTYTSLAEVKFFGTPGPTTLDKGSLTLGRSLDVPRVSRYDVDTETPRPEKLVVDFDTTVNSTATDISGQGNHGTFYNGASYSAADKAFTFDASTEMIYTNGASGLPTGDAIYSMSAWIKHEATPSSGTHPVVFGFGSAWASDQLAIINLRDGNKLGSDIGSSSLSSVDAVITQNQWHHVVICKVGTGLLTTDTIRLYLDGVEITDKQLNNAARTQALGTSIYVSVGAGFNSQTSPTSPFTGKVSNPKIYSVALEPSEVRKLYNLGRTGRSMVISDTAVGIGKVPEAQLDVRGVANFGSRVGIGTTNPGKTLDVNGSLRTRYSSGYRSGTFNTTGLNMGSFSELGPDMPQIGWEIHVVFSCANNSSTVNIYGGYRSSGGVNSTASGTLYAISEPSTWRWSEGYAHDYLSSSNAILAHDTASGHASYYAVIRVVNSHYTNADEGNGRLHVSSECVGTRNGVGATIWKSVGYLGFAGGDNGRFHTLRILSSSGNIKGQWTGFPITT